MIKLRVIQARYGDCLILESGAGKRRKYILVDGGPSKVYQPYLRPELEQIAAQGGRLGLVILTHVDTDHVIGLLEMMRDLKQQRASGQPGPVEIDAMWHNAFQQIMPEIGQEAAVIEEDVHLSVPADELQDVSFGIGDGEQLRLADDVLGIPRNAAYPDPEKLVRLESAPRPLRMLGMRLWVLGPTTANLETLKRAWLDWVASHAAVSFAVGEEVKPDDSVNNLSSIMLLAESGSGKKLRRILLTGDGLGSDVVAGLESAGLLKSGAAFHVDILKLPHHGSARNVIGPRGNPADFFDRVLANTYLISADGRHDNPDWDTLCWLTDASSRQHRPIEIVATNPTDNLTRLLAERPPENYCYHLTILSSGQRSITL